MDRESVVERKTALVRENLLRLRELARLDEGSFRSDFRNLASAEHLLQTSIQALVDLSALAVAERGIGVPERSTDLPAELCRAGLLPADRSDTYARMIRFRNVIVHLYNHVDEARVYAILVAELPDVEAWLDDMVRVLAPPAPGA